MGTVTVKARTIRADGVPMWQRATPHAMHPSSKGWTTGGLLHGLAAHHGGEIVHDLHVDDEHIPFVAVFRTGVFVIGHRADVERQRDVITRVFDLPVTIEAAVMDDLVALARVLVGTQTRPRPEMLTDQQVGRVAARLRLGGVVRILGA
jgi:hypothetical protein